MPHLVPADFDGLITDAKLIEIATDDKSVVESIEDPEVVANVVAASAHAWEHEMWGPFARVAVQPELCPAGRAKELLKQLTRYHLYMRTPNALLADNGREHPVVAAYKLTLATINRIGLRQEPIPVGLVAIATPCSRNLCTPPELEII